MEMSDTADWKQELKNITEIILQSEPEAIHVKSSLERMVRMFETIGGISPPEYGINTGFTETPQGIAFYPELAASCTLDSIRTAKYLRAAKKAILDLQKKFPGERIHILYAGTGPYAPLAIPLCTVFSPGEIKISFIDIHQESTNSVRKIIDELGFQECTGNIFTEDATRHSHSQEDPFHMIISENLQKALFQEPQIAILLNLYPQMKTGGVMIPQNHILDAWLSDGAKIHEIVVTESLASLDDRYHQRMGTVFEFSEETIQDLVIQKNREEYQKINRIRGNTIEMEKLPHSNTILSIITSLHLYDDIFLGYNESGLTSIEIMEQRLPMDSGKKFAFSYLLGYEPRITMDVL